MIKDATMVFKHPGPHAQDGVSYEYLIVPAAEVEASVAQGWARSVPEAKARHDGKTAPPAVKEDETSPPTRAELEQKAKELNIKFDGRTSDRASTGHSRDDSEKAAFAGLFRAFR